MIVQVCFHLCKQSGGLRNQLSGSGEFLAMGGPNTISTVANSYARLGKCLFASGVLESEVIDSSTANIFYLVRHSCTSFCLMTIVYHNCKCNALLCTSQTWVLLIDHQNRPLPSVACLLPTFYKWIL